MKLLFLLILSVTMLAGCAEVGRQHRIRVVILNFRGPTYLTISPEAYYKHLFDDTGTYRETPGGAPTFGSVREWFLAQSHGKFSLSGDVVGPFVADDLWAEVERRNTAFEQSATEPTPQGEWWVAAIRRNAEQALRRNHIEVTADEPLLIIQNGKNHAWTAGKSIVAYGNRSGNTDIVEIGVLTHELGHFFLNQPDRYTFKWGDLKQWDTMATSYSDFPAGFTGEGRVGAGWAQWGDWVAEHNFQQHVATLAEYSAIPRYRARLDNLDGAKGFFSLEHRRHSGTELSSQLPAEGLMLLESDPQEMRLITAATPGAEFAKTTANHVYAHRDFSDFIHGQSEYQNWALPYRNDTNSRNSFSCADGTSLNILGECLWEFKNIRAVSLPGRPDTTEMQTESLWKVMPVTSLITTLEPSRVGRRLYFTTRRGFSLRLAGAGYGVRSNMHAPEVSRPKQYVVDLDALKEGGTVEFQGLSLSDIQDANIVNRSLSMPYHLTGLNRAHLRNGQVWLTSHGAAHPDPQGSSFEFLLPRYHSPRNLAEVEFGLIRFVMAFANDAEPVPTNKDLFENITVRYCPLGRTIAAVGCIDAFKGQIEARRKDPFVLLIPMWFLDLPGEAIPQGLVQVTRGTASTTADLVVLSAGTEVAAPSMGRVVDAQLQNVLPLISFFPSTPERATLPPPSSACTMNLDAIENLQN